MRREVGDSRLERSGDKGRFPRPALCDRLGHDWRRNFDPPDTETCATCFETRNVERHGSDDDFTHRLP